MAAPVVKVEENQSAYYSCLLKSIIMTKRQLLTLQLALMKDPTRRDGYLGTAAGSTYISYIDPRPEFHYVIGRCVSKGSEVMTERVPRNTGDAGASEFEYKSGFKRAHPRLDAAGCEH